MSVDHKYGQSGLRFNNPAGGFIETNGLGFGIQNLDRVSLSCDESGQEQGPDWRLYRNQGFSQFLKNFIFAGVRMK